MVRPASYAWTCLLLIVSTSTLQQESQAWVSSSFGSSSTATGQRTLSRPASLVMRNMVESLSLETLGDNHEAIGSDLSGSVQRWLDAEWMPQDVHVKMGESCKVSYMQCRQEGVADLMSIMMQVADDLTEDWREYDKDAFVNAWDVTNYVSDYLTAKTGVEGCECTARIY